VLSCTDDQSRNRRLGLQLATGCTPEAAHEAVGGVVEGMGTVTTVAGLAREHAIDMPICQAVDAILSGGETAAGALTGLLSREATTEFSFAAP
ncbi:MAG: glycerol-3-phosphate dehydrogenase, partial [Gammaproteobacteria bacterium]|nr:glycerol-3-phosphate dehydrogenase [Gammaproteobacteria bacterium]NNM01723.1 glycerol-3-phosphate dehydrogenase [Gammaproteobacteria bacterium]